MGEETRPSHRPPASCLGNENKGIQKGTLKEGLDHSYVHSELCNEPCRTASLFLTFNFKPSAGNQADITDNDKFLVLDLKIFFPPFNCLSN